MRIAGTIDAIRRSPKVDLKYRWEKYPEKYPLRKAMPGAKRKIKVSVGTAKLILVFYY